MEIETILTIDFDVIMGPSIELYNHLINEHFGVKEAKDKINNLLFYCDADLIIYSKLTTYLLQLYGCINPINVHFIYDHEQICNYLEKNKKYNIINIDHHHDYGYENNRSNLYCGNWVLKMEEKNLLNSYLWIGNSTSGLMPKGKKKFINFYDCDLNSLQIPDKLIICASFQWIPEQFHPLFYLWLQLYNLYYGSVTKNIEDNLSIFDSNN